jgi:hypothetical protein
MSTGRDQYKRSLFDRCAPEAAHDLYLAWPGRERKALRELYDSSTLIRRTMYENAPAQVL